MWVCLPPGGVRTSASYEHTPADTLTPSPTHQLITHNSYIDSSISASNSSLPDLSVAEVRIKEGISSHRDKMVFSYCFRFLSSSFRFSLSIFVKTSARGRSR